MTETTQLVNAHWHAIQRVALALLDADRMEQPEPDFTQRAYGRTRRHRFACAY
jgi:hypothetical protein